jgi:hypothetical protein
MLPPAFVVARRAPKAARTGRWQICRVSRHSLDHVAIEAITLRAMDVHVA